MIYSAPDNYFANQYSTGENSIQPVPADFNQYHKLKHSPGSTEKTRYNGLRYIHVTVVQNLLMRPLSQVFTYVNKCPTRRYLVWDKF